MKKIEVYECEVRFEDGTVETHGCAAKTEKEFRKMLCNLLYCNERQLFNIRKFEGIKR